MTALVCAAGCVLVMFPPYAHLRSYALHVEPVLHRHVRPPASYGVLCSKSAWSAGRRQMGLAQVACRTWDRCRSLTPGSWPLASCRWSQGSVVSGAPGTFTVTTRAGDEVTADIWFRCYGVVPASDYLAGGLAAARRPDGFVEVTPELLVGGQDRVFALGDVSAADQNKGAGGAGRQAPIVVSNIRALITGDGGLARYEPPPAGIIVPIGPDGGGGQRPDSADLVPAEVVAQLKGRDMMVQRFAELLGVSATAES